MSLNANDAMSSYRPFGHRWLDSAVQETLLPGSPWQQVYDRLSQALAKRIHPELSDSDTRAAIFDLLGVGFLQKYLSKWTWALPVQGLGDRSPEERRLILQSTQLVLKEKLDLAATDCGYLIPKNQSGSSSSLTPAEQQAPPPKQVPEEVIATISKMAAIFSNGMHRYLVQEGMQYPTLDTKEEPQLPPQLTQLQRDKPTPPSSDEDPPSTTSGQDNIPNCWGQTSDLLGRSLCAILRRDPHRLEEVCRKLSGRQLPGSLRFRVWNEVLLKNYKDAYEGEKSVEWFLRKNFAKTVMRGKTELGIASTTDSPIGRLIETAVQETYTGTPCMLKHSGQAMEKETREALNILYVYDRSYQPYFILWLYPLQLAIRDRSSTGDKTSDDHPYELALQLDLLGSYTFPQWSEVLAIAQDVMGSVEREDPAFYAHLMSCSRTNVKMEPQDFLVQQIHGEQQKASSFTSRVNEESLAMATGENTGSEMLASPVMFLRKWLGEGFVGVCDTQAVLYMWDQCFMTGWDHDVLHRLCLALLMLLRKNFMMLAQDYHVMKQIFLSEPCRLYTLDIQRAFQLLERGGAMTDIPALNRRQIKGPEKKAK